MHTVAANRGPEACLELWAPTTNPKSPARTKPPRCTHSDPARLSSLHIIVLLLFTHRQQVGEGSAS